MIKVTTECRCNMCGKVAVLPNTTPPQLPAGWIAVVTSGFVPQDNRLHFCSQACCDRWNETVRRKANRIKVTD